MLVCLRPGLFVRLCVWLRVYFHVFACLRVWLAGCLHMLACQRTALAVCVFAGVSAYLLMWLRICLFHCFVHVCLCYILICVVLFGFVCCVVTRLDDNIMVLY